MACAPTVESETILALTPEVDEARYALFLQPISASLPLALTPEVDEARYCTAIASDTLDAQGMVIDQIIGHAIDELAARYIELRVYEPTAGSTAL